MCISSPLPGNIRIKTHRQNEILDLLQEGDDRSVDTSTVYISRMQCVQAAIESQISDLQSSNPECKVGLVTFNREVTIIGDGASELSIVGDKLNSYEELVKCAQGLSFIQRPVGQSASSLIEKVLSIQEDGPTALGPALLVSSVLAAEGGSGSTVILCTDGLANIGIGNFETEDPEAFYTEISRFASERGVAISVISIEGEECKLESLAQVTEASGGNVIRIVPEKLTQEFANVLADTVIATHVNVTVTLHKALKFVNEDPNDLLWNMSRLTKHVGNVTDNSSFSFEYCLKNPAELERDGVDLAGISSVGIQALFEYLTLDGNKCLRCITKMMPITDSVEEAMKNAKLDIMMRNHNRQANRMVQQGKLIKAKERLKELRSNLQRVAEGDAQDIAEWSNNLEMNIERQVEGERALGLVIDEEEKESLKARKATYNDSLSYAGRSRPKRSNN